ncbi:FAD-dependent oxidoreductase [Mucilaginibacter sp. dw_454]|uniref:FAD-dependent oxidoreductase n=1 Tax=Mucilaginibacter sp. dw_454 TaxID=2720079 RepID=UPI001BD2D70D|nr:FAD-dependent oxidoreductase [Mucilaginibacter sp. dw_454]
MFKKLFVLILVFYSSVTFAETIKTDVLVIGNGPGAVAAALQSARSKLKTVLLTKGSWMPAFQSKEMMMVTDFHNLPSGIWGEFRKQVHQFYKTKQGYDTTYTAPLQFEAFAGAGILKKIADTTTRLTLKLNAPYTAIEKDGTGWEITYTQNGKTNYIKTKTLIDATDGSELVKMAGASLPPALTYNDNLYRTSIVAGDNLAIPVNIGGKGVDPSQMYFIPMSSLVVKNADNLFVTENVLQNKTDLPVQMAIGQGAGTMAAYCAFFKTTTKNLKVRAIQGELLDFKGYLLPFDDINPRDHYFRAIQQIAATGLIKGVINKLNSDQTQYLFMPDSAVYTAEIKPVFTEIYSRAFLWFNNTQPGLKFTTGNLLSFISEITLTDPEGFQHTMQKEWIGKYKFKSDFDLNHQITRREFAILANQYLNPFARTVDLSGRMIN